MKNIKLYELEETYRNEESSLEYPTVSYTKDTDKVWYVVKSTSPFEFVDLGLSVKWATCNIGANSPEDRGLYFQYGDTQGYSIADVDNGIKAFNNSDYKFTLDNGVTYTKYNENDSLTVLEATDDAATLLDNTARIPSNDDFNELIANTTVEWATINDINGLRLISNINSNYIFIPAAGGYNGGMFVFDNMYGLLRTNTLSNGNRTYFVRFAEGAMSVSSSGNRSDGYNIRAVKP